MVEYEYTLACLSLLFLMDNILHLEEPHVHMRRYLKPIYLSSICKHTASLCHPLSLWICILVVYFAFGKLNFLKGTSWNFQVGTSHLDRKFQGNQVPKACSRKRDMAPGRQNSLDHKIFCPMRKDVVEKTLVGSSKIRDPMAVCKKIVHLFPFRTLLMYHVPLTRFHSLGM